MNYKHFFLTVVSLVAITSCEKDKFDSTELQSQTVVEQTTNSKLQYVTVTDSGVLKDLNKLGFNITDFPVVEILNRADLNNGYILEGDLFVSKKQIESKLEKLTKEATNNTGNSAKRVGLFDGLLSVATCESVRNIRVKLDFEFSTRLQKRVDDLQAIAEERALTATEQQLLTETESRLLVARAVRFHIRRSIRQINRVENSFLNFELVVNRNEPADVNVELSDGIVINGTDLSRFAAVTSLPDDDGNINPLFIVNIPMARTFDPISFRNLLTHELLHTVGFAHVDNGFDFSIGIEGTPSTPNPRSIMHAALNPNLRITRSDRTAITEVFGTDNPNNICDLPRRVAITGTDPI